MNPEQRKDTRLVNIGVISDEMARLAGSESPKVHVFNLWDSYTPFIAGRTGAGKTSSLSNMMRLIFSAKEEALRALETIQIETRDKKTSEIEVELLKQPREKLELENERLKTRVAELQRSLNREIQRFDQGSTRFDDVLGLLHEANKANNTLQAVLIARDDGRLRIFETYDGVVKQADDEEIVVLFEIEDELIEQTYKKEQFIGGRLPSPSDRFTVYVHGALLPRIEKEKEYNPPLTRVENGETRKPRKFDTGPLEV